MINHIIFDCFGTLIDTGTGSINAVKQILFNVNSNVDAKSFYADWKRQKKVLMNESCLTGFADEKTLFKISLAQTFADYGIAADAGVEVKPMIDTLFGDRRVYDDVKAALKMLDDKKIEYVVGSTTDNDSLMYYLELNDLRFAKIFTSEDMKVYKPNPLFYEKILSANGWRAGECLFVGDSLVDDVCGPKSVGMMAVLLDRKGTFAEDESDVKPDYVIRSLLDLADVLAKD